MAALQSAWHGWQPDWSLPAHIKAVSTQRTGGLSGGPYGALDGAGGLNLGDHVGDAPVAVQANRRLLAAAIGAEPTFLSQVHGIRVVPAENLQPGESADAVFSRTPGVVCAILTADCLPVLFCDEAGTVVAAAHAGWRGLAAGILQQTVAHMRAIGAGDISAWLGPAIGPQQFEVGQEVVDVFTLRHPNTLQYFEKKSVDTTQIAAPHKYLADIYGLARLILQQVGVNQVCGGEHCTVTEAARFYSYRRDGVTGRMASLIWLE